MGASGKDPDMNILGYHIFDVAACQWLSDDEQSWGGHDDAACFTSCDAAAEIARRERGDRPVAIMADCGSPS